MTPPGPSELAGRRELHALVRLLKSYNSIHRSDSVSGVLPRLKACLADTRTSLSKVEDHNKYMGLHFMVV